jgi:hypothetical protein
MISSFQGFRFRVLGGVQDGGEAIQADTVNRQIQIDKGGGAGMIYGQVPGRYGDPLK